MTIELGDIRRAVYYYCQNKVSISVSPPVPSSGSVINPNEEFTMEVTATNAPWNEGGVGLKNIRWCVRVNEESPISLVLPPDPWVARNGFHESDLKVDPSQRIDFMWVFPPADRSTLGIESKETFTIKGKAGAQPLGGSGLVTVNFMADMDMDSLIPRDIATNLLETEVVVIG
jgi:hypothetical protein